ncbi:MAG: lipopolysaccharide biosynthesis protein [Prevotella sp.]|jgi:O-antigen/teichoic acid export membrane protein|nr:lipopolysaccharide biosynthesis protein [Prevotella sp.]
MENLKEKTAKGLMWGAVNNGTMQVLNLLIGIMILRKLSPEDTGLIGMLAIFSAIAGNLQSSGFSTALINEKKPTAAQYNSVFWFNILMGGLLYAVLFCSAPLIAWFFHQPRLTDLSRFLFLAFFISSFGISTNAYLVKNMMNREITIINIAALLLSGTTAIVMAQNGMAYWSLAWQQVVNSLVLVLGRFYYVRWKPSLRFTFDYIRQTFSFSMKILVTMIVNTVNQNMLTVIFGRLFRDARVVGNFFQAYKWDAMAFQTVGGMLSQVAQPVLVSVRDERERELQVFRKMVRFAAFLSFPALFGLALVAREFILCTIGEKWIDCVPLLQILCLSGAFMPLFTLFQNLVISHGRSDVNMWLNIGQILLQLVVILLFYRQGITVMVIAYSLFNILWLIAWQPFARRIIGLRMTDLLRDTVPFVIISAVVMLAVHYATLPVENLWLLLLLRIIVAAALYYAAMRLLNVAILRECMQFVFKKKR